MAPDNSTRLYEWRWAQQLTQAEAAERLGTVQGVWSPWERGSKIPGLDNALALEELTGGEVRASDWPTRKTRHRRVRERAA